jgi:hypothetical protein
MTEEIELALAYWRTMARQPKALAYVAAIEAKLKGEDTDAIVVDHELTNAISRGASIARAKGIKVDGAEANSQREAEARPAEEPKAKRVRKPKVVEA